MQLASCYSKQYAQPGALQYTVYRSVRLEPGVHKYETSHDTQACGLLIFIPPFSAADGTAVRF